MRSSATKAWSATSSCSRRNRPAEPLRGVVATQKTLSVRFGSPRSRRAPRTVQRARPLRLEIRDIGCGNGGVVDQNDVLVVVPLGVDRPVIAAGDHVPAVD